MTAPQRWSKLASFPLTNAIGVAMLGAWLGTGLVALCFALASTQLHPLVVPLEWWDALKWFSAYAFAQFAAKRASHADLWKRNTDAALPPV